MSKQTLNVRFVLSFILLIGGISFMYSCGEANSSATITPETIVKETRIRKPHHTMYNTMEVDGIDIFYRESGPADAPTIVLLHGYPTSSHMYRNLITDLSDSYHLIAPDYPGYGRSEQPRMADFDYTFDNMAKLMEGLLKKKGIKKYSLYLMDYGAPIGFRIATKHPERVESLIIQNGCAYEEGLEKFWDPIKAYWADNSEKNAKPLEAFHTPNGLFWQYTHGSRDVAMISPDNWEIDLRHLYRPENDKIQLAMFYDYRTNPPLYAKWQQYFRDHQPPTLVVYGENDEIFPVAGAEAYKKDLKNLDFHLYDAGHFALECHGIEIARQVRKFMVKNSLQLSSNN